MSLASNARAAAALVLPPALGSATAAHHIGRKIRLAQEKRVYTRLMGFAFALLRLSERVGDSLRLAVF